jgi:hypothetical protein
MLVTNLIVGGVGGTEWHFASAAGDMAGKSVGSPGVPSTYGSSSFDSEAGTQVVVPQSRE